MAPRKSSANPLDQPPRLAYKVEAEYRERIKYRQDHSLGMQRLQALIREMKRAQDFVWWRVIGCTFHLSLVPAILLASQVKDFAIPVVVACLLGIIAIWLVELLRGYGGIKQRLDDWAFSLKLFSGELEDHLFSSGARSLIDNIATGRGEFAFVRGAMLFGLEMERFIPVPGSSAGPLTILGFAAAQTGCALLVAAEPADWHPQWPLLVSMVVSTIVLEVLIMIAVGKVRRVWFMLNYLREAAEVQERNITGVWKL